MAKTPAFQFYAADFLIDTAEMTDQEVGVYIRLLSHQWVNGSLNSDPNRLANGVANGVLCVWDDIKHKFPMCEDGRLRNAKLEETRQQQHSFKEKQSLSGKKGAIKRWGKDGNPNGGPIGESMALQSSTSTSVNKNKKVPKKKINYESWPSMPDEQLFDDWMEVRKAKKSRNTQTAIDGLGRELSLAVSCGVSVNQCVQMAVERSWAGFKFQWYENENGKDNDVKKSWNESEFDGKDYITGSSAEGGFEFRGDESTGEMPE